MPALVAANTLPLQIEGFSPYIAEVLEAQPTLAKLFGNGNGGATRVSERAFRARLKVALAGSPKQFDPDTGSFPQGTGNLYDQMLLTPVFWLLAVQYSMLAAMMEGEGVATDSAVSQTIADVVRQCATFRDIFLQGSGDGSLGSVDSTTGTNYINLRSTTTTTIDGRGAHLVKPQQVVQVMSNAYVLRGSCTIQQVFNSLGSTQQIQVDTIPPGTVSGDLIIADGVASGSPQFVSGLRYFINTSTIGNLYGISRSSYPYVVANGVNLSNNSQITKPVFRLIENQIAQRLGDVGIDDQFYHTHYSQLQALEELAFNDSYVPLQNGTAQAYDPMFQKFTINGRKVTAQPHADQTIWDLVWKKTWFSIKWGAGMFWYKNRGGQMVFQMVDPTTGTPTAQEAMYYCLSEQWFVGNPISQGGATGCKVPGGI